jgi:hypothetical protein
MLAVSLGIQFGIARKAESQRAERVVNQVAVRLFPSLELRMQAISVVLLKYLRSSKAAQCMNLPESASGR